LGCTSNGDARAHVAARVLLRLAVEVLFLADVDARERVALERLVAERVRLEPRREAGVVAALDLVLVLDAVLLLDLHGQDVADLRARNVGDRADRGSAAHVRVLRCAREREGERRAGEQRVRRAAHCGTTTSPGP
jgi:hypothetical protein